MTNFEATSRLAVLCGSLLHLLSRCSYSPVHASGLVIGLSLFWSMPAAAISLQSDTDTATAGYFQLNWQAEETIDEYLLLESGQADFSNARSVYRGADLATVISGKSDGSYYYRVADASNPGNHSKTVVVQVKHHPLSVAFMFFSVGAVVFVATLFLIFSAKHKQAA